MQGDGAVTCVELLRAFDVPVRAVTSRIVSVEQTSKTHSEGSRSSIVCRSGVAKASWSSRSLAVQLSSHISSS